ncbi:MAG: lipid-A-disaccharide synthase [Pseudomonadota bacterium]
MGDLVLYVIAGEPSGDRLGGALMTALAAERSAQFRGVGGRDMIAAGLQSRFDMSELTVMGISEVLPRLPLILRRIRETADDVIATRPDALITIDSPDFTLRVAKRVRRALPDIKVIHYVAPSVWAWRPARAAKMARSVDHVLALLPFEPPYMEAAGMTCDFVGHPVVSKVQPTREEVAAYRQGLGLGPDDRALLLAPGSRRGEVRRLGQDFLETVRLLRREMPTLAVVCPVAETVEAEVRALLSELPGPVHIIPPEGGDAKRLAFAAADAALCASGTVTLELAAAGTPMVAAYRTTWLTAQIVRRVIRVNTANLINLIDRSETVPEFLQEFATPDALASALMPLLTKPAAASAQTDVFASVMEKLGRGNTPPAVRAAKSVLDLIDGRRAQPDPGRLPDLTDIPGPMARHRGKP